MSNTNKNKTRKFLVYLVQQGIVNYVEISYDIVDEREHLMRAVGVDEITYIEVDKKITEVAQEILFFRKHKVLIYVHNTKDFHLVELESYGDGSLDVEGEMYDKYSDVVNKSSYDYIVLEDDHDIAVNDITLKIINHLYYNNKPNYVI